VIPGEGYEDRDQFKLLSGRSDLAFCLYETFVETLGTDVGKWDTDLCEAVNEKVTKKRIRITTCADDPTGYADANTIKIIDGEVVIAVQPRRVTERFCNSWGTTDPTFGDRLSKLV